MKEKIKSFGEKARAFVKNEKFPKITLWFFGILAGVFGVYTVLYYVIGPAEGYFHSDCTDSMFWALATYDSGEIVSPDYNYAAILPFSATLWYLPLIAIFGVTMKTHVIGMVIFTVLFALSIVFLCRTLKWSYPASLVAMSCVLLAISGSDKLREIMWGHTIYYSLGLLLLFFGLGLAIRVMRCKLLTEGDVDVKSILWIFGYAIFTMLSATNGTQVLVLCVIPIAGALFCERFFDTGIKLWDKKNVRAVFVIAVAGVATIFGLKLLAIWKGDIVAGYQDAYSTYSSMNEWINNLLSLPMQYFSLIGVSYEANAPLMDAASVVNLVKIGTGLIILIIPLVGFFFYNKYKFEETRIVLWVNLFVGAFVMMGWILGKLSNASWRLTPMFGFAIFATAAIIRDLLSRKDALMRFACICAAAMICFCTVNMKAIVKMPFDFGRDNDLHMLAETLEKEGLSYGYATFWYAQAITVISDNEVKTRNIIVENNNIVQYTYQSEYSWYADQPGQDEYFVLLNNYEYSLVGKYFEFGAPEADDSYIAQLSRHMVRKIDLENYKIVVFDCNIWEFS